MAEFLEVSRIWDRICKANGDTCLGCVLASKGELSCRVAVAKYPEWFEETVMKWAAEHPQKTIIQVLREAFPHITDQVISVLCPGMLDPKWEDSCIGNCDECWSRVVPEEDANG